MRRGEFSENLVINKSQIKNVLLSIFHFLTKADREATPVGVVDVAPDANDRVVYDSDETGKETNRMGTDHFSENLL